MRRIIVMSTVAPWMSGSLANFGSRVSKGPRGDFVSVDVSRSRPMQQDQPNLELSNLLISVANGESGAFSRLYDLTSEMVYGLALRVLKAPAIAEEVTQEVYLQVWSGARNFDPERGTAKAWIATLAHRRAVDAVRRSQSARDREQRVVPDPPHGDVAESAVETDERDRVRQALSGLTDLQWEAIELAYFDGMTYREVAEHLDTPLGTVKSRMRDGLQRLRQTMGEDHG